MSYAKPRYIQIQQAPAIWFRTGHNLITVVYSAEILGYDINLFFEKSSLHLSSLSTPEYFCAQYFTDALRKLCLSMLCFFILDESTTTHKTSPFT